MDTHWPKTIKAVTTHFFLHSICLNQNLAIPEAWPIFYSFLYCPTGSYPEPRWKDQFFLRPLKVRLRNISEPECVHHKQVAFIDYLSNHKNNYRWQITSSKRKVAELGDWGKLLTAATSQAPVTGEDCLNISMKRTCIPKR